MDYITSAEQPVGVELLGRVVNLGTSGFKGFTEGIVVVLLANPKRKSLAPSEGSIGSSVLVQSVGNLFVDFTLQLTNGLFCERSRKVNAVVVLHLEGGDVREVDGNSAGFRQQRNALHLGIVDGKVVLRDADVVINYVTL